MEKYIKVKQFIKMLKNQDPEAEIFMEMALPKEFKNFGNSFGVSLTKPKFHDAYTDIDGSKNVWCTFKSRIEKY